MERSAGMLAEQSSTQTVEKQCGTELSEMSQEVMLEEKQSEKMTSREKQQSEELREVSELLSQHTEAAQEERVHRQEETEKWHQVLHGSLQAEKRERSRFEAEMHQTTAQMDQRMSEVGEKLQNVEAEKLQDKLVTAQEAAIKEHARVRAAHDAESRKEAEAATARREAASRAKQEPLPQEDGAGETVTGTALMAGTGTSVLEPAKEAFKEEIRGFADTVFVQTDAQVERMLDINDHDKWEQYEETRGAKALRKSTLDGRPMRAGSVLFSGKVSEDGEQPLGISLLELVQRVVKAVHRTKLDKLMHRELIRCECEPGSLARITVDRLTGARHMREVFKVLYENHPYHGIRFHESKWKGDLLTISGPSQAR